MNPVSAVDLVVCPTCDTLCPPSATRCECGERLAPPNPTSLAEVTPLPQCSCGDRGVCTVCVIASYEPEGR